MSPLTMTPLSAVLMSSPRHCRGLPATPDVIQDDVAAVDYEAIVALPLLRADTENNRKRTDGSEASFLLPALPVPICSNAGESLGQHRREFPRSLLPGRCRRSAWL